jgi:flavin reductase (DIM6/NTAB) family NADH-FMN oxidoreductase RutF
MSVDSASFRQALAQFASGVTVVTTRDAVGRPQGLTVSSFCSVSLEPPMVLVCVDRRSEAHMGFQASGIFGVSVLAEHQEAVSRRFAGGLDDKFEGQDLLPGVTGAPLIPGALAHIECRLVSAHPGGDHTIYVGEVENLSVFPGRPLLYHASGYRRLDGANGTGPC